MIDLAQIVEELSTVLDKPAAEKVGRVILSVYQSAVLQRLDALENALQRLGEEMRRSMEQLAQRVEEQLAAHRRETDERFRELREEFEEHRRLTDQRFRELREEQQRMYAEFVEYRKQTDERFRELAEAQRRTEQRVEELAQFQQRAYQEFQEYRKQTEERFRELREEQQRMYAEFVEYRKQTDERFRELREEMQRMYAEFQEYRKQTDERFRELREEFEEHRRMTDERFRELAETVRLTQEALRELALTVKDLQRQVGGLSQAFGYVLENEAIKRLPRLLLRDHGVRVEGRLKRGYVQDSSGRHIEVNLFGTGRRDGEQITIVGESKSQLSKRDIDRFLQRTVESLREVYPNILPIVVTHMTSEPDAEDYARRLGVVVYYSYEF